MNDQALLDRYVRLRDERAFEEVVRRYVDLVYSTCLRRVGSTQLAEDVTQNVFFLLAQKAGKISGRVVLAGWLYQAARYASKDAMKAERRRMRRETMAAREAGAVESTGEWERISPELEEAMDRLAREDREAILLRYFKGMGMAETASAMGLSAGVVSKRLQRAMEKLRRNLAERGVQCQADVFGAVIAGNAVRTAPVKVVDAAIRPVGHTVKGSGGGMLFKAAAVLVIATVVVAVGIWERGKAASRPVVAMNPVSGEQAEVIRAQIYRLRHYNVFAMPEEWMGAIRKLVEIGRPAVPELVAELDRTQNDMTMRAMGFTLRAIGDPRACPALIRALSRTSVRSSDYGLNTKDRSLREFMIAHGLYQAGDVEYGRAVREMMGALEGMTHHRETALDGAQIDANDDTPEKLAEARHKHEAFSKLWQTWWDANHAKVVSETELASLTMEEHDPARIEAAGQKAWGALFPTGKPYRLSAIREAMVPVWDSNIDTPFLVDFDREPAVFSPLQSVAWLKPEVKESDHAPGIWFTSDGAGADANGSESLIIPPGHQKSIGRGMSTYDPRDPAIGHVYGLYGQDIEVWQTADSMWEELPGWVEAGKEVKLDANGPRSGFDWRDPAKGKMDSSHRPATFVFRTREGGAGIVQLLAGTEGVKKAHMRYRVIEPHPGNFVPRAAAPERRGGEYSEVHAVTLGPENSAEASAIGLDTGKVFVAPAEGDRDPKKPTAWIRKLQADAVSVEFYQSTKLSGLRLHGAISYGISNGAFDTLSPGLLDDALDRLVAQAERLVMVDTTVIFRTADGASGILQVMSITEKPGGVKFRYKIISRE